MIDIKVPTVGESITEVSLTKWLKKAGDYVQRDEAIAELESEKATFEVNAEQAGILKTLAAEGDTIKIGDVMAQIDETAKAPAVAASNTATEKQTAQNKTIAPSPQAAPPTAKPETTIKASPVAAAILADKKNG